MKKESKNGFISLYVLLILLVFALTISFIYKENESNFDNAESLYNKKVAMFEAESLLNMIIEENSGEDESEIGNKNYYDLINSFDSKSELEVSHGDAKNNVTEAQGAKVLNVNAVYKSTKSLAVLVYKIDENKKLVIIYKKVY